MKRIALVAFSLFAASCGIEEVGRRPHTVTGEVWTRPGTGAGAGKPDRTVIYVTALDYPDSYDWRTDREKGSVKCSLVVYADGVPKMKLPVGDRYETSSDPDMHRMIKGHLYTDYSTETETVIKKDGEEMFRYSEREMICDMIEKDGEIYTLGHNRDGDGFTYRKNGDKLMERTSGRSFGRLCHEGDSISFAFYEPVETADESLERYYCYVNGDVVQAAVREDVKNVWDIVFRRGEVYCLASVVGISSPVILRPDGMQALKMFPTMKLLTCKMIATDGPVYVEGLYQVGEKPLTSCLWDENGVIQNFTEGMTISSCCKSGDGVCCVLSGDTNQKEGIIYKCGETFSIPSGYVAAGGSPAVVVGGILHVGLTSRTGDVPLIWKDGETTPLNINGFISTISTNMD